MEVQLTELEAIKTKLITERNDVAAVVRKEFAENLDRLTDENSRMATELQNQVRKKIEPGKFVVDLMFSNFRLLHTKLSAWRRT